MSDDRHIIQNKKDRIKAIDSIIKSLEDEKRILQKIIDEWEMEYGPTEKIE